VASSEHRARQAVAAAAQAAQAAVDENGAVSPGKTGEFNGKMVVLWQKCVFYGQQWLFYVIWKQNWMVFR
jgi:hypothetical protein